MSKVVFGGFISYTTHLCKAFRNQGHDCTIYKIRMRTESKERIFGDGIGSINVSMEDALDIIKYSDYSIVTATWWRGWNDKIAPLLEAGAEVVLHDHTDYNHEFKDFMIDYEIRPIVIRLANQLNLERDGLEPEFVPHPYLPVRYDYDMPLSQNRKCHAVSVCRMDYDKKTEILIAANNLLPQEKQIHFWGAHTRMYMYQKIVGKYKGWDDDKHYTGHNYPREQQKFPREEEGFAALINADADFSCDMSAIKGDGGGTQYSFLEAMDGGAVIVLNRKWFTGNTDELIEDYTCLAVTDAEELADLLCYESRDDWLNIVENYEIILRNHKPKLIIDHMLEFLEGEKKWRS